MQDPKKLTLLQKHASGTPSIVVAEIDFNNDISHVSRGGNRITIVFIPLNQVPMKYQDRRTECGTFITRLVQR